MGGSQVSACYPLCLNDSSVLSKSQGLACVGGGSICRGRSEAVEGPQFLRSLMKLAMTKAKDNSLLASRVERVLSSVGGDQTPDSWDTPNIQPKNTSSGLWVWLLDDTTPTARFSHKKKMCGEKLCSDLNPLSLLWWLEPVWPLLGSIGHHSRASLLLPPPALSCLTLYIHDAGHSLKWLLMRGLERFFAQNNFSCFTIMAEISTIKITPSCSEKQHIIKIVLILESERLRKFIFPTF